VITTGKGATSKWIVPRHGTIISAPPGNQSTIVGHNVIYVMFDDDQGRIDGPFLAGEVVAEL